MQKVYENRKQQRKKFFDPIHKIQCTNDNVDPEQVWRDVLHAQQTVRFSGWKRKG